VPIVQILFQIFRVWLVNKNSRNVEEKLRTQAACIKSCKICRRSTAYQNVSELALAWPNSCLLLAVGLYIPACLSLFYLFIAEHLLMTLNIDGMKGISIYNYDVIHERIGKHHTKLEDHLNPLLEPLLRPAYNRRLNRCCPFDLQDTWGDIAGCTPHHVTVSRPHISLKIDCNHYDCW
jgi:hypothetical protein